MKKVVVTGGTGFLGKRLIQQLIGQGVEVSCMVRAGSDAEALARTLSSPQSDRLSTFTGCLERPQSCAVALQGCDVLFHVASALKGSVPSLFLSNVIGTRGLLEQASRAGVKRVVLIGSIAVHGVGRLPRNSVVDETCPLDAEPHRRDPYTFSKVEQEHVARQVCQEKQLPLIIVRPGVIYGPGRDCITGRVGLRFGKLVMKLGDQRLPYTFVDNCASAIRLAGSTPGIEGESFNIVDDDPPTSSELLAQYRRLVERLRVVPIPECAIGPLSRLCEWYHHWSRGQLPAVLTPYKSAAQWKPLRYRNDKAKSLLGWKPQVDFPEGLRQTLSWLKDRPRHQQLAN